MADEWLAQGEAEYRENKLRLEVMEIGRTSEEVISDTILTQVTCQTPVSESPNKADILRNIEEAATSPQLDQYEVQFEENSIDTEDDMNNPTYNNEVRIQQANMRRLFIQRDTPKRYDPGTGSASDWRSDMAASINRVVSEYCFTQGDYN